MNLNTAFIKSDLFDVCVTMTDGGEDIPRQTTMHYVADAGKIKIT